MRKKGTPVFSNYLVALFQHFPSSTRFTNQMSALWQNKAFKCLFHCPSWRCRTSSDEKLAWDNVFFLFCMAASWRNFDGRWGFHASMARETINTIQVSRTDHWPKNIVRRNCFNVLYSIICFALLFVLPPLTLLCFCLIGNWSHGYQNTTQLK